MVERNDCYMKKTWLVIAFNNSQKTLIRKNPQPSMVVDL